MTTAYDIIRLSFQSVGVLGEGQTLSGEDTQDGLRLLNMMLGQWNRRRWLVYHLVDTAAPSTGAASYSVGPGGDFDVTVRPARLEAAYARLNPSQPNPVDYPLQVLEAREDYANLVPLKTLSTFPSYIFYDSAYPSGRVYPWPVPDTQFELHLVLTAILSTFASLSAEVELPPEYEEALWANLAIRLCPVYQIGATPELQQLARTSLDTLVQANTQVPRLTIPTRLRRRGLYNIFSDQAY